MGPKIIPLALSQQEEAPNLLQATFVPTALNFWQVLHAFFLPTLPLHITILFFLSCEAFSGSSCFLLPPSYIPQSSGHLNKGLPLL
jgi:hypothetical protein